MEAPNRDDKYAHSEDLKVNFEELIAAGNSLKTIGQIMELQISFLLMNDQLLETNKSYRELCFKRLVKLFKRLEFLSS
ncbi:hypothetical protein [Priestia megaterium]|uniref:hypothetical protein n=1 Tax=Priestia megaterium TaxID=1404 RepID=UPI002E1BDAE3|nr:hypothetical protein [Priestia megaterium]